MPSADAWCGPATPRAPRCGRCRSRFASAGPCEHAGSGVGSCPESDGRRRRRAGFRGIVTGGSRGGADARTQDANHRSGRRSSRRWRFCCPPPLRRSPGMRRARRGAKCSRVQSVRARATARGGQSLTAARNVFLQLATPEAAISRVRRRVSQGGHDVPDGVVRRRFQKGWRNFERVYRDLVDEWIVYDNSGDAPRLVDRGMRQ